MSRLQTEIIEVVSPYGFSQARIAKCHCGSIAFVVFQIDGQSTMHLQCDACDSTFCAGPCTHKDHAEARADA